MPNAPARLSVEEREKLILDHYPMVRRVAYRLVSRYPSCVEADDLVTIGMLGLIDAVDRFEHDRSISFSAYARIRVQGAIVDELRKVDWVPRSVRNRADRISKSRDLLQERLQRPPTAEELAEHLGVEVTRLQEMIRDSTVRTLVSMDEGGDDEDPVRDHLAAEDADPLEFAMQSHQREVVRDAISELPERERNLVEMYYYRDLTFKEIGKILGVTESRVSQLHSRLKKRLMARLQKATEAEAA